MSSDVLGRGVETPAFSGSPARSSLAWLAAGSVVAAAPLGVAALADPKSALITIAGALVIAGLAAVWVVARNRVADALLLAAVACMALPIDKYFAYRPHLGGWPGFRVSAADLALAALAPLLFVGWAVHRVRNALPRSVLWCYGLVLLQYGISTLNAANPGLSGLEFASAVHALLIAFLVAAAFRPTLIRPVLALIAAQVIVHSAFAMAQAFTGRPIGSAWFKGATIVQETLENGAVRIRPSGLFDHPIVFADMLMLAIPMLVAGLFIAKQWLWRVGLVFALSCGLIGLALTLSRGAWISTGCTAIVFAVAAARQRLATPRQFRRLAVVVVLAALLVAPFIAPLAYERLADSNEGNLRVRFELNAIALNMIEAHPLAGVGLSNFIPAMGDYDPRDVERYFPATVHNIYLLEGAEAGIPGMLAFIALFAAVLLSGFRRLKYVQDNGARWMATAILAGLVGFLVSELADFSHRLEPLRSLIWMNVGLLFALERSRRNDGSAQPGARR